MNIDICYIMIFSYNLHVFYALSNLNVLSPKLYGTVVTDYSILYLMLFIALCLGTISIRPHIRGSKTRVG